jgi:proliferating cell nuclear antigen
MDSSHVSLISVFLHCQGFEKFFCDKTVSLGVNLVSLYKILKCSSNEDSMTLIWKDDPETLSFIFESNSSDRISEFQLKLLQSNSEQLGIPDTNYSATVRLAASEYKRICNDLSGLGDSITLEISDDGIKFEVEGDIGNGVIHLKKTIKEDNSDERVHVELSEPVRMAFSMKYLQSFSKATILCDKITLKLAKEIPLQMEFNVESIGYVRYYLAPKIEKDMI